MAAIGGKRAGNAVVAPVQLRGVADLSHARWGLHDGADIAPILQAAHDWLRDTYGGGVILVPPGRYSLGRDVYFDCDSIEVIGAGRNLTTITTQGVTSLIVGLPRSPAGRVLSNGHRPDLFGQLDASACPAAGVKWAVRTFDPATATFAHPAFFGGPLNGGKAVGAYPNYSPDFWATLGQLTVEWALDTPAGTLADGPIFGAVSNSVRPSTFVPYGNSSTAVAEPYHLWYDAAGARYRLVFTTVDPDGVIRNRVVHFPVASVPVGLHRVSLTIDLDGAVILPLVDGTQVAPDLSLIDGAGAAATDWLPGRGLRFLPNQYAPFNIGVVDMMATSDGIGGVIGGVANLDRTFAGFRVSEGYIYENRGVGQAQRRLDGVPVDDLHRFFYGDPGTICWLYLTDPPGPDRAVRLATGPRGGDGASPTRGLFLSAEHGVLGNLNVYGTAIRHLTLEGGGPWGMPVTKGAPLNCTFDDITATGGWSGVGGSLFGVSYPYTIKGNCSFRGADSGWFGYTEIVNFQDRTDFPYVGRTAIRLIAGAPTLNGAFFATPGQDCEYGVMLHDFPNGGNAVITGIGFDAEGGAAPKYAIVCMESHQSKGWTDTLAVRDCGIGTLGEGAAVVLLRSTAPSSALPGHCIVENVAVTGGGNRAVIRLDDPGQRWTVSARDMRHVHDDVPWIEYSPGTTPGGATVELDGFTVPPRRGVWAPNSFVLRVPNPLPGQYRAWVGPYRGEACGSANPPEWTGIDPVGDGRSLAGYCLGQSSTLNVPPPIVPPPPFSPADVAGLELWLEADAIPGLADGDPVATWSDGSTNHNDAAQATAGSRPTWHAAGTGGKPTVRFDGVDDCLNLPDAFDVTGERTVFIIFKDADVTAVKILLYLTSGADWVIGGFSGSSLLLSTDADAAHSKITSALVSDAPYLLAIAKSANLIESIRRNGADDTQPDGGTWGSVQAHCAFGASMAGGTPGLAFDGDISAFLVYSRTLTGPEITEIETYLNDKYTVF